MSRRFNNAIVLKKGIVDILSNGESCYYVATESSLKRCGGQGDILAGIIGTFASFSSNLEMGLEGQLIDDREKLLLSTLAASIVNRKASFLAFKERTLSLTTPDILNIMHIVIN